MTVSKLIVAASLVLSSSAFAGECLLSITRVPCPGKDVEAFKPYAGQKTTEEKKSSADAVACTKEAEKASKIVRKGTLAKKTVLAKFDGAAVDGGKEFVGTSECK
jgi:hypothetical protein